MARYKLWRAIRVIRAIRGYCLSEKYGSVIKNFGVDKFLSQSFFDRHIDDFRPAKRGHESELLFRDENASRAAGHSRMDGDPARMASHDFDHHDAFMRFRCGAQPVNSLRHDLNGGVESERVIGSGEVVVDGFRHAHNRIPLLT